MRKGLFLFLILLFIASPLLKGEELRGSFLSLFKTYFTLPQNIDNELNDEIKEDSFENLFGIFSKYIPPEEKPYAYDFFRYKLFGDATPIVKSLSNAYFSKRLIPYKNSSILYYLFLEEELSDNSIVKDIFRGNPVDFFERFSIYGESKEKVKVRFAVFVLKKMVEYKIIRSSPQMMPLIWTTTKRLKSGECEIFRFQPSYDTPFLRLEFGGATSSKVKVISILLNEDGSVSKIGVSNMINQPLIIPQGRGNLYVVFFNSDDKECEDLISATFFKEFSPPVYVISSPFSSDFLKVTIEEENGILGYTLIEEVEGRFKEASEFVQSFGKGMGDYLFYFDFKEGYSYYIKVFTSSGFTYMIPIEIEK